MEFIPVGHKILLSELEDVILAVECKRIEEAIFYVLDNEDELKRAVLGF